MGTVFSRKRIELSSYPINRNILNFIDKSYITLSQLLVNFKTQNMLCNWIN